MSALQVQKNPLGYIYACRLYAAWENVCLCNGHAIFIKVWIITPGLTCNWTCEVILSVNSYSTKVPLGIPVSAHWALRVYFECCEMYMPKQKIVICFHSFVCSWWIGILYFRLVLLMLIVMEQRCTLMKHLCALIMADKTWNQCLCRSHLHFSVCVSWTHRSCLGKDTQEPGHTSMGLPKSSS